MFVCNCVCVGGWFNGQNGCCLDPGFHMIMQVYLKPFPSM